MQFQPELRAQSSAHPSNAQVHLLGGQSSLSTLKDEERQEVIFKKTLVSQVQQAESSSTHQHRCHGYKWQCLPSTRMECNLGRVQRASLKSHYHVMAACPGAPGATPCPCAALAEGSSFPSSPVKPTLCPHCPRVGQFQLIIPQEFYFLKMEIASARGMDNIFICQEQD